MSSRLIEIFEDEYGLLTFKIIKSGGTLRDELLVDSRNPLREAFTKLPSI